MKKTVFVLVLVLLLTLAAAALGDDALQSGDFTYKVVDGCAVVTKYNGSGPDVVIPDEMGGYPVTELGGGCFYWNDEVITVACPDSLQVIGESVFEYCTELATIDLPDGLTTIGRHAFFYCESLSGFAIPPAVVSVGEEAFYWCMKLETAYLPDGLQELGAGAFQYCDSLTAASIPAGIPEVSENLFDGCGALTSVTLHDGITRIGAHSFYYCESLSELVLPDAITDIGDTAFYHCESLPVPALPESIRTIGWSAFNGCLKLDVQAFPEGLQAIGSRAFSGCTLLKAADLPAGLRTLGDSAFAGCESLSSARVPAAIWQIGRDVFDGCVQLQSVDYYGAVEPAEHPVWTLGSLELYLGWPLSSFTPENPQANTCMMVVDTYTSIMTDNGIEEVFSENTQAIENALIGRMQKIQQELVAVSGDRLAFTNDPQMATVLLLYSESYPSAGEGSVNGLWYDLYNHGIAFGTLDVRTGESFAVVAEMNKLGVGSRVTTGAGGAWADAPSLNTDAVKAFLEQIIAQTQADGN